MTMMFTDKPKKKTPFIDDSYHKVLPNFTYGD